MTITEIQLYAVIAAIAVVLIVVLTYCRRKPVPPFVVCPKCGTSIRTEPRKSWLMPAGKTVELTIGIFDCPKCGKPFRRVINKRRIDVGTTERRGEKGGG